MLRKLIHYYSLLGVTGVAEFLLAKSLGTHPVVKKTFRGIRHPVFVRIATTDLSVLKQVLVERQYDVALPRPPKVIVDAGANIGLAAVFFANKHPQATIVALEPEEGNFKILQKNVASYPQITPLRMALWSENKQLRILDPGAGDHGFRTAEGDDCQGGLHQMIQAITIDALMEMMGFSAIDVLKIDIEGSEKEVFEHSTKWINTVNVLMVELHDYIKSGCSRAFAEATEEFDRCPTGGETVVRYRNNSVA